MDRTSVQKASSLTSSLIALLQLFFCYFGLLRVINLICYTIYGLHPQVAPEVLDWVRGVTDPYKRIELGTFMGAYVATIAYVLLNMLLWTKISKRMDTLRARFAGSNVRRAIEILLPVLVINCFIHFTLAPRSPQLGYTLFLEFGPYLAIFIWIASLIAGLAGWLDLGLLPQGLRDAFIEIPVFVARQTRALFWISCVGMTALYFSIYQPMIFGQFRFLDEYFGLPATVIVQGHDKLEDFEIINSIPQLALRKTDYRKPVNQVARPHLPVTNVTWAREFVRNERSKSYYFDDYSKTLISMRVILPPDETLLRQYGQTSHDFTDQQLDAFVQSTREREMMKATPVTNDQYRVGASIVYMLELQSQSRWYFHHHNFLYGPINKIFRGQPIRSVFFQYGLGSGLAIGALTKLLHGQFNVESYFSTWALLFPVYFALFILAVWYTTRSRLITVFCTCIFLGFTLTQTYEHVFLGPGLNPIRHFLDIGILCLMALYAQNLSRRRLWFLIFACWANFALSPEFGLFAAAGFYVVIAVLLIERKIKFDLFTAASGAIFSLGLLLGWHYLRLGTEDVLDLYVAGFFSAKVPSVLLFSFLLTILLGYFALVRSKLDLTVRLPALFAWTYALGISSYVEWGTTWNHLVNASPILALAVGLMLHLLLCSARNHNKKAVSQFGKVLALTSVLALIPLYIMHVESQDTYEAVLDHFEFYDWTLPGMHLKMGWPQSFFEKPVSLIKKFSAKEEIFMLSKYDNILPTLSEKYNGLSANELATSILTTKNFDKASARLKSEKPQFLFVDSDIDTPSTDEIIDPNTQFIGPFFLESYMRVERVNMLKKLFREVSQDYVPVETEGLLTVWKRK